MTAVDIKQRYPEEWAYYQEWWRALTREGDPARMPNIAWEAFRAGFEIARKSAT